VLAVQYAGLAQMIFSEDVSLLATSPRVGSFEMREKVWDDLHQAREIEGEERTSKDEPEDAGELPGLPRQGIAIAGAGGFTRPQLSLWGGKPPRQGRRGARE